MTHIEEEILKTLSVYGDKTTKELSKIIGFSNQGALTVFLERLREQKRVTFEEKVIDEQLLKKQYVWSINHDYYSRPGA